MVKREARIALLAKTYRDVYVCIVLRGCLGLDDIVVSFSCRDVVERCIAKGKGVGGEVRYVILDNATECTNVINEMRSDITYLDADLLDAKMRQFIEAVRRLAIKLTLDIVMLRDDRGFKS